MDTVLDSIRIIPIEQISAFEWDSQPDDESIETPGVIKHPLPIVERDDDDFVLLAQTAELATLKHQGFDCVPAQIYNRSALRIAAGSILLSGFGPRDLSRLVSSHSEQIAVGEKASAAPDGFLSATLEFFSGPIARLYLRHSSQYGCPASIDLLFRAVVAHGAYHPENNATNRPDTPFKVAAPTARLTLPELTLPDVLSAAATGRTFPPGTIRVKTPFRVLSIDFPTHVLEADLPVTEKETFLRDLILFREQDRRTDFFEGPVYIFNR